MPTRSVRWWLLAPTLLAAVVRLGHLGFLAARDPLFREPVVDAWFHAHQALQIVDAGWLLPGTGAFYKGPLLSYLFAVLFSFFGPQTGVIALRLVNVVLGIAVVFLAARIAERLGGRRAAWIAGLATALYGMAVYFDATLLQPPLLSLLLLAAGERLLVARGADQPERPLAAAGLLLGLLTITRGEGLLSVALAALWAAVVSSRRAWEKLSPLRAAALVVVPAVLVVAPVTVRNAVLERDPVVLSWNGGINFFMGNDPAFEQVSGNWHPDLAWMRLYDAPKMLGLTRGADHQRFFLRQAAWAIVHHPVRTAGLWLEKAALLFTGYEISDNQRIYEGRDKSPVLAALLWRWGPIAFPLAWPRPSSPPASCSAAAAARAGRRHCCC